MSRATTARAAGSAGLAWGGLLLARSDALWRAVTGRAPSEVEGAVVAVLGARHLGQGLLQVVAPTRLTTPWLLTDLAHAASMVALAVVDPGRRRPALVSAAVSAVMAAASLGAVRSGRRAPAPAAPLVTPRRARRPRR